jgi:HlyD family secretion protein
LKRAALTLVLVALGVALWLHFRQPEPPEAPAARVKRGDLVQTLTTNGKVEAFDSVDVSARAGLSVIKVNVQEGDQVRRGQLLAEVDTAAAREALAHAQAQLEAARADEAVLERGGSSAEIAQIDSAIAEARLERETAEKEIAVLQRLVEKGAAPRVELQEQQRRLIKAEMDMAALERKRKSFLGPEDRERIQARVREAQAAVAQAMTALSQTEVRAPISGTLYMLALRPGGYYAPGAVVAKVGLLDKVRVRLLVDEPELGPVRIGQPVRITWDALPGVEWEGSVERLPSLIQTVGTRNVGELLCTIDTRERRLLPNVTVNVAIRTGEARNALTIPREALVREGDKTMALVVDANGMVSRQAVRLGIHDLGRVQVLEGLADNQIVLLPGEHIYSPGQQVRPKITT